MKYLNEPQNHKNNDLNRTFGGDLFAQQKWYIDQIKGVECLALSPQNREVLAPCLNEDMMKIENIHQEDGPLKILFFGDSVDVHGSDYKSDQDLLAKMIKAMKLNEDQVLRYFSSNIKEENHIEIFLQKLEKLKPKVVVSLGALATNLILGKKEKLSAIHGQFFTKTRGNHEFIVVPIFHPDFLAINVNMKRTAWADLQKIISYLE